MDLLITLPFKWNAHWIIFYNYLVLFDFFYNYPIKYKKWERNSFKLQEGLVYGGQYEKTFLLKNSIY